MTRAALLLVATVACAPAEGNPGPARGPIVLELFTSQGCSSCPPADRVVSRLAADGKVGERAVIPLAFHVDYWNDLGWADPFSRAAWTERQRRYAAAIKGGRVYTPQLVIAGRDHVVGSHVAAVGAAVARAPLPARVDAAVEWSADRAVVSAVAPAGADVWVAIYEDGAVTRVPRGENAGETLRDDHIVRRFERVAAAGSRGRITVDLDRAWGRLGAVVLAQGKDMAVVGTRELPGR